MRKLRTWSHSHTHSCFLHFPHKHSLTTNPPPILSPIFFSFTQTTTFYFPLLFTIDINPVTHTNTKTQKLKHTHTHSCSCQFSSMAPSDQSRHSLVPGFLYSSKTLSHLNNNTNHELPPSSSPQGGTNTKSPMILSPKEGIRMFSPAYYAACSAGGIFSCGLTHMAVTPLDLVKCNMQVLYFPFSIHSTVFSIISYQWCFTWFHESWMKTTMLIQVIKSLVFLKQCQEGFRGK